MPVYSAFGLVISTVFPLEGLANSSGSPDVIIESGKVPEELNEVHHKGVLFQSAPGQFLLKIKNIGKFLVLNGNQIIVEADKSANTKDIGVFIIGSVIGALLLQRNIYAFHGSALVYNDKCIILSGKSGAGKSTLSAFLVTRGMELITDDLCALTFDTKGKPLVHRGTNSFKLWKDAALHMGIYDDELIRVREGIDKFYIPTASTTMKPIIADTVFFLNPLQFSPVKCEEVNGFSKLALLKANTYRYQYLKGLDKMLVHFEAMSQLGKHARIFKISRPQQGFCLNEIADLIFKQLD